MAKKNRKTWQLGIEDLNGDKRFVEIRGDEVRAAKADPFAVAEKMGFRGVVSAWVVAP